MRNYRVPSGLLALHSIALLGFILLGVSGVLHAQTVVTSYPYMPLGLAVDSSSNLYITSSDYPSGGSVYEIPYGVSLPDNCPDLISSAFNEPTGAAISSSSGPLYVLDNYDGYYATIYGDGTAIDFPDLQESPIEYGAGPALDSSGNLYFADGQLGVLYEYNPGTNTTTTLVGAPDGLGYYGDGSSAASAGLISPDAIAVDSNGNVFIADGTLVRVIYNGGITIPNYPSPTVGYIYTYAGGGSGCSYPCSATDAYLSAPPGLAVDSSGDLFIADYGEQVIWEVSGGTISILMSGVRPWALAFDSNYGYLYYTIEYGYSYVYRITP